MDKGAWRGVEKRVCPGDDQEHHYGHDHEGHDGLRDHGHYGHGGQLVIVIMHQKRTEIRFIRS